MLTRRKFIRSFGITIVALTGAKYFWQVFRYRDKHSVIEDAISLKLPYLDLEQAEIRRFAQDFISEYGDEYQKSFEQIRFQVFPFGRISRATDDFKDHVAQVFIQSSNLWTVPFDDSKKVKYIALYDPYIAGCNNIFAEFI
ncbi:MAG: hypothetical protein H6619_06345 [Deltaproteobacteria bacterium]|nr:hypothetical protein [Deltaproteobacteria bacterium]